MATEQMTAPTVSSLLAQAARLRQAGRVADSIAPLRQASRLNPLAWMIQHDLGLACLECGLLADAVAALQRAIQGNPRDGKMHWRLGIALQQHGNAEAAIEAYRTAVKLLPGLGDAQYRLATLLESLGHRTEAIACYRRAASSAPKTSLGRLANAAALLAENRDPEAERVLLQTLALDPASATAHEMLGNVLADSGRFSEAREHFEQAITRAPHRAGAYYDLARCRRITPADAPLLERMQTALASVTLDAGQRVKLHLALGKASDDLGDYAGAMQHFNAADADRSRLLHFDLDRFNRQVDALIARFTAAAIAAAAAHGSSDATPIIIMGMPRSGTTLVEQIISSHPKVAAGGEMHFWNRRGAMMEQAPGLAPEFLRLAAADYTKFIRALGQTPDRITDKMPTNFLWAGLLHVAFPNALIIHCRRLPIATALSIHQTHFSPQLPFPTGGTDLVGYYRAYERLMQHWRLTLPADRFLEVEYEALTQDPATATRLIIDRAGLPWNDDCIEDCIRPDRNRRIIKTASKWQARQPIYQTAIDNWRRYQPFLGSLAALAP